jgi:serine/threonine-protein kinase
MKTKPPESGPGNASGKVFRPAHKATVDPLVGKTIQVGHRAYRIEDFIGTGGMSRAYTGRELTDQSKVVIKFLQPKCEAMDEAELSRSLKEVGVHARVKHPNVVDVRHVGVHEGKVYVVMEPLEGMELSKMLKKTREINDTMPWERIKPILLQVCNALDAMHREGIIHRQLKPSKIVLIKEKGEFKVKVLQSSISKFTLDGEQDCRFERQGMFVGTPTYTSPEQASGKMGYDHRVDVYSLGVVMYEMLCGQVPFKGEMTYETFKMHIGQVPVPPSERNPEGNIPEAVENIVMKALSKDPNDRFQSIDDMKEAILSS